ncbi:MAG TPA: isochorismatase family cysteine hydrolase [Xanthobacteraceae bacterium]|jgi:ureidoacrylate peracid hydrolase
MSSDELLTTLEQKANPGWAALLVIDVQNDFAADGGFFDQIGADVRSIQTTVIPSLIRFVERARAAGILVVFVQAIYDAKDLSAPMRERNRRRQVEMPRCLTGSWGADFHGVRPAPGEPVVIKHRYSAMHNTELDAILKRQGIRSLLLSGISTDTCVESTGRDAYFMDYYVTLVADCCGAFDESDHLGAIKRFDRDYGAVVTSGDLISMWERRARSVRRDVAVAHG